MTNNSAEFSEFDVLAEDGARFVVRHHPNPSATRLYITHGNGFAVDGYRVFWEPLLAGFDIVTFDMRNHGRNPMSGADGHHYQRMAVDLAAIHAAAEDRLVLIEVWADWCAPCARSWPRAATSRSPPRSCAVTAACGSSTKASSSAAGPEATPRRTSESAPRWLYSGGPFR